MVSVVLVRAGAIGMPVVAAGRPARVPVRAEVRRAAASFLRPANSPAKLRLLLSCLLLICLAWGALAELTVARYSGAANDVVASSEPLSLDAQQLYRALSDADATVTTGFVAGGLEPRAARRRYLADVARSARLLEAATALAGRPAAGPLATLAAGLPVYAGEVETARADERLGLPLGAAYLREASGMLRGTLLPAAYGLYAGQNARLAAVSTRATGLPPLVITVVVGLLIGLVFYRAQRWLSRRTHRILNIGLAAASAALAVSLVWMAVAIIAARADLLTAAEQGAKPVQALATADIAALRAHADESLTLIDNSGDDSFQADFLAIEHRLGPGQGTLLDAADQAASGSPGAAQASAAARTATAWFAAHRRVRSLDDTGAHSAAVRLATGLGAGDSGTLFRRLEGDLSAAIGAEQAVFRSQAQAGLNAFGVLEAGVAVAAIVMLAGCVRGLGRRLAEYR